MRTAATFEIDYVQFLGEDGRLLREDLPEFAKDPKALVALFKQMLLVRAFDTKAVALQRTGKLGTYASCLGHEATHIGIGSAMQLDDVLAPSYREYGAQFVRGVKPRETSRRNAVCSGGSSMTIGAASARPTCCMSS